MRRTFWVALGAAGGVLAYRRGQQLLEEARAKGVVGSVQAASGSAAGLATQARGLLATLGGTGTGTGDARPAPAGGATGSAAARVLAESTSRSATPTPPKEGNR